MYVVVIQGKGMGDDVTHILGSFRTKDNALDFGRSVQRMIDRRTIEQDSLYHITVWVEPVARPLLTEIRDWIREA